MADRSAFATMVAAAASVVPLASARVAALAWPLASGLVLALE
jgi:hypothetical protein